MTNSESYVRIIHPEILRGVLEMSAPTSPSPVSRSSLVTSKIEGLEEVYFTLRVLSKQPQPLLPRLSLVFCSEKTAQIANKFLKSSVSPEIYIPDGESKETRCWAMDLANWQFSQSHSVTGAIQNVLNAMEKEMPVNKGEKKFPVVVLLPSPLDDF